MPFGQTQTDLTNALAAKAPLNGAVLNDSGGSPSVDTNARALRFNDPNADHWTLAILPGGASIRVGYDPATDNAGLQMVTLDGTTLMRIDADGSTTFTGAVFFAGGSGVDAEGFFNGDGKKLTNIFHVTDSAATSGTVAAVGDYPHETINLTSGSTIGSITIDLSGIQDGRRITLHTKSAVTAITFFGTDYTFEDTAVNTLVAGATVTFQRSGTVFIRLQ